MIHGELPSGPADLWNHWPVRPSVAIPIILVVLVYARGVDRLWKRAGVGRTITKTRVVAFTGGVVALVLALLTPLDPLGEVLFSAHMVQHLLLILVAAPLLVAGAPEIAAMWALPPPARRRVGQWVAPLHRAGEDPERGALLSLVAVAVATLVLWAWHVPALYDLAVRDEGVHAAEHAAFLATAVVFWATVLRVGRRAHARNGVRVLLVFAMAVQGSALGALITFAATPLYAAHAAIPEVWGITPLPDQQLAGLLMWIPPALLYIAVAAYLFIRWLEEIERRTRQRERRASRAVGPTREIAMRTRTNVSILAAALVVVACEENADVPEGAIGSDTSAAAAQRMLSPAGGAVELGEPVLTAAFRQVAPDSADDEITGTLRLYPDTASADTAVGAGGFRVEVVMDGLTAGPHAWHIHTGSCEERGRIAVPLSRIPTSEGLAGPLEADAGLTARALVTIPGDALTLGQLGAAPYSLHVHGGAGLDPGPTLACADLS